MSVTGQGSRWSWRATIRGFAVVWRLMTWVRSSVALTASVFYAVTAVLATPVIDVDWLGLAPHPTAPRAARDFVTRTLLGWRLDRVIPGANQVIPDLVSRS